MGALSGIRVLEFEAIGPGPFGGMLLADMGADVLRVDRALPPEDLGPLVGSGRRNDVTGRSRSSVTLDLKQAGGRNAALELIERADVVIEGFRPGTMERLGLGPEVAMARNSRLVYARITGWGQTGPLADRAGHDLNYGAISGTLVGSGRVNGRPLNLVGGYGGAGMLLALGVVSALLNVQRGGMGQVLDASTLESATLLGAVVLGSSASSAKREEGASSQSDEGEGGPPWYGSYRTSDGQYMAVGAIESRFYDELLDKLELADAGLLDRKDRRNWPLLRQRIRAAFLTRTRAQWCKVFEPGDACVVPVLDFAEALNHPQHRARGSFVEVAGMAQPGPAPRFLGTPSPAPRAAPYRGQYGGSALRAWGFDAMEIAGLRELGLGFLPEEQSPPKLWGTHQPESNLGSS